MKKASDMFTQYWLALTLSLVALTILPAMLPFIETLGDQVSKFNTQIGSISAFILFIAFMHWISTWRDLAINFGAAEKAQLLMESRTAAEEMTKRVIREQRLTTQIENEAHIARVVVETIAQKDAPSDAEKACLIDRLDKALKSHDKYSRLCSASSALCDSLLSQQTADREEMNALKKQV